ncbi:CCDC90 family protein [Bordetella ansorpii]|nr:hypothetical protein [Bordetella ansorpii]
MTAMAIRFNTLEVVERLERGGFSAEQARAQVEVLASVVNTDTLDAATKTDLATVEDKLDTRITHVEHRLEAKLDAVERRLDARITSVEHKLEQFRRTSEGQFNLLRWMVGFVLAGTSGLFYKIFLGAAGG